MATKNDIIYGHLTNINDFKFKSHNKNEKYGIYKVGLTTRTVSKRYSEHSRHHEIIDELFEKNVYECTSVEIYLLLALKLNFLYTNSHFTASNIILHRKDKGNEYFEGYESDILKYLNFITNDDFLNMVNMKMNIDNIKCIYKRCSFTTHSFTILTKHIKNSHSEKFYNDNKKQINDLRPHLNTEDISKSYFIKEMGKELFDFCNSYFIINVGTKTYNYKKKLNDFNLNPLIINSRNIILNNLNKSIMASSSAVAKSGVSDLSIDKKIDLLDIELTKYNSEVFKLSVEVVNKNILVYNKYLDHNSKIAIFERDNFTNLLYLNYKNNEFLILNNIQQLNDYIIKLSTEINDKIAKTNQLANNALINYNNGKLITIYNDDKYNYYFNAHNLYYISYNSYNEISSLININDNHISELIKIQSEAFNNAIIKSSVKGGKKKVYLNI